MTKLLVEWFLNSLRVLFMLASFIGMIALICIIISHLNPVYIIAIVTTSAMGGLLLTVPRDG